jgi:hypothetical protein
LTAGQSHSSLKTAKPSHVLHGATGYYVMNPKNQDIFPLPQPRNLSQRSTNKRTLTGSNRNASGHM